jgi:hypothetical protein
LTRLAGRFLEPQVSLAKQRTEELRFSAAELKVQALARRRANFQLLRVSWPRFRRAYEEYPQWQSLALWTRAVIAGEGHVPSKLSATLQKHCPRFINSELSDREPELLAFQLLEWVHNHRFAYAKRQGWLDALTFYGVRHPRSQAAWALWERCDKEQGKISSTILSFEEWEQRVLKTTICGGAAYEEVAAAVERYIDWDATDLWLSPLFASNGKLPTHVVLELERRFPRLPGRTRSGSALSTKRERRDWQSNIRAHRDACLSDATAKARLDDLAQRARSHPRRVRFIAYGKYWEAEWSRKPQQDYPTFRQWRLAADQYNQASGNRSQ